MHTQLYRPRYGMSCFQIINEYLAIIERHENMVNSNKGIGILRITLP